MSKHETDETDETDEFLPFWVTSDLCGLVLINAARFPLNCIAPSGLQDCA